MGGELGELAPGGTTGEGRLAVWSLPERTRPVRSPQTCLLAAARISGLILQLTWSHVRQEKIPAHEALTPL